MIIQSIISTLYDFKTEILLLFIQTDYFQFMHQIVTTSNSI